MVQQKADAQELAWDEVWSKEEKKELAITKTEEAQEEINRLETILLHTLDIDDTIDWDSLLDKKKYHLEKPMKKKFNSIPPEPKIQDTRHQISAYTWFFLINYFLNQE